MPGEVSTEVYVHLYIFMLIVTSHKEVVETTVLPDRQNIVSRSVV